MREKIKRPFVVLGVMVTAMLAAALPASAQEETTADVVGPVFENSVNGFVDQVMELAPYLFAGLVAVLLIRLAIRWFQRVTRSV